MTSGVYKRTKEHNIRNSEARKRFYRNGGIGGMFGKKHSKETRKKMSEDKEKARKISLALKGRKLSKESIIKRTKTRRKNGSWFKNLEKTKRKARISKQKYILKTCGGPTIGKNEKQILDELELLFGYKIIRQFKVEGYSVDGYIPKLNLVIEIDESYHKINKKRDNKRKNKIKNKLKCLFIRIKDFY